LLCYCSVLFVDPLRSFSVRHRLDCAESKKVGVRRGGSKLECMCVGATDRLCGVRFETCDVVRISTLEFGNMASEIFDGLLTRLQSIERWSNFHATQVSASTFLLLIVWIWLRSFCTYLQRLLLLPTMSTLRAAPTPPREDNNTAVGNLGTNDSQPHTGFTPCSLVVQ
jgi:hypothetical protein